MATAQENIDTIITNALATANFAVDDATTQADEIYALADGTYLSSWSGAPTLPDPEAVEPDMLYENDAALIFDQKLADLIALLSAQLGIFFTTYYPLSSDAFNDAQSWLVDVIQDGGTGIPKAVEDAIWQRDRDRLINDADAVEDTVLNSAAARGLYYPDEYSGFKSREAQFARLSETGKQSTSIATKQAEIEVESIKFAVELATNTRISALQAGSDYIRALATAFDTATDITQLNPNAKSKMINAVSNLYNARLNRDQLIINRDVTKRGQNRQYWADYQRAHWDEFSNKVSALAEAANVLAKVAASALSTLNTVASTTNAAFSS